MSTPPPVAPKPPAPPAKPTPAAAPKKKIAPKVKSSERRLEFMPLGTLKGAKRNPKDHDLSGIEESFDAFGYVEPITMDERTGRLVAGHGRLESLTLMRTKGLNPPEGIKVAPDGTWLLPIVRGWASKNDANAEGYIIASNKTPENGGWKNDMLGEMLEDLAKADKLRGTGFGSSEVEKLIEKLGEPAGVEFQPTPAVQILVTCKTEKEQAELLMKLTKEGYDCRSLIG